MAKPLITMLFRTVGKPRLFIAEKGYDGDIVREEQLPQGIEPVITLKCKALTCKKYVIIAEWLGKELRFGLCILTLGGRTPNKAA